MHCVLHAAVGLTDSVICPDNTNVRSFPAQTLSPQCPSSSLLLALAIATDVGQTVYRRRS